MLIVEYLTNESSSWNKFQILDVCLSVASSFIEWLNDLKKNPCADEENRLCVSPFSAKPPVSSRKFLFSLYTYIIKLAEIPAGNCLRPGAHLV